MNNILSLSKTTKTTKFSVIYIDYSGMRHEKEVEGTDRNNVISKLRNCKEVTFCAPTMEGELYELSPYSPYRA